MIEAHSQADPRADAQVEGADGELIADGQEEVFSRTAVELGVVKDPSAIGPDEPQTRRLNNVAAVPGRERLKGDPEAAAKDAPITAKEVAEQPPTRQGGADAGRTADDPGRGGD